MRGCRSSRGICVCRTDCWAEGLGGDRLGQRAGQGMVGGVCDLRQALDHDVVAGMEAEHVDQTHVAVDVVRVLQEVCRVEGAGDVPPQAVALGEQKFDELRRQLYSVVLDVEDGVGAGQNLLFLQYFRRRDACCRSGGHERDEDRHRGAGQ